MIKYWFGGAVSPEDRDHCLLQNSSMPASEEISVGTTAVRFGKTDRSVLKPVLSPDPSLRRRACQAPGPHRLSSRSKTRMSRDRPPPSEAGGSGAQRRPERRRQRDECGIITIILVWTEAIVLRGKYFSLSVLSLQEARTKSTSVWQNKPGLRYLTILQGPDGPCSYSVPFRSS